MSESGPLLPPEHTTSPGHHRARNLTNAQAKRTPSACGCPDLDGAAVADLGLNPEDAQGPGRVISVVRDDVPHRGAIGVDQNGVLRCPIPFGGAGCVTLSPTGPDFSVRKYFVVKTRWLVER